MNKKEFLDHLSTELGPEFASDASKFLSNPAMGLQILSDCYIEANKIDVQPKDISPIRFLRLSLLGCASALTAIRPDLKEFSEPGSILWIAYLMGRADERACLDATDAVAKLTGALPPMEPPK